MTPLWTSAEIATATGGNASAAFLAAGVAFDSREVGPGDLFVALKGEATDGHRFVDQAFAQGAAGAIVGETVDHPHVLVADTMDALNALAAAARARTAAEIVGVTGSVGKTGTKEALFAALDRAAPGRAHRSVKSYNNHTGVPLSLARMPADSRFGVFEMGMNHAGELRRLTALVRPHVALVTAIAPAHSAFFASEEAIADAKGEIFAGLEPGGTAIIPFDSPHRDRLIAAAKPHAARILTFGRGGGADVRAAEAMRIDAGTLVSAILPEAGVTFTLASPGDHWVSNALAVLAAVDAVGGDLAAAGLALGELAGLAGRGARVTIALDDGEALLIDESYNANPASMAATLAMLGEERARRRIAVLGEMRELGAGSAAYHAALAEPLLAAKVDHALLVGPAMAPLARGTGRAYRGRLRARGRGGARAAPAHRPAGRCHPRQGIERTRPVRTRRRDGKDAMLYLIADHLGFPGLLNLIRYITFRAGAAAITALVIGLIIGPRFIGWLRLRQGKGQPIREDGPRSHLAKRGTPTMGGLMILTSLGISLLLWMNLATATPGRCCS